MRAESVAEAGLNGQERLAAKFSKSEKYKSILMQQHRHTDGEEYVLDELFTSDF